MNHEQSNSHDVLWTLLREYNEQPDRRDEITREVDRRFRRDVALMVLDSSGFTRTTRLRGIIHFLALLERLRRIVSPIVARRGGRILKTEADNIFAVFDSPAQAVSCADEILRSLQAANEALPAADEIYVSIGIGYGSVLLVEPDEMYGDEMNLTCKLGEDLARRGEVLLTPTAHANLGESNYRFEELNFTISGVDVVGYRVRQ